MSAATSPAPDSKDWPLLRFARFEAALEAGDLDRAAAAQCELERLGVRVEPVATWPRGGQDVPTDSAPTTASGNTVEDLARRWRVAEQGYKFGLPKTRGPKLLALPAQRPAAALPTITRAADIDLLTAPNAASLFLLQPACGAA